MTNIYLKLPTSASQTYTAFLPLAYFFLYIELDSSITLPVVVEITETPASIIAMGVSFLGGGTVLHLNNQATIINEDSFISILGFGSTDVPSLSSFTLNYRNSKIKIDMKSTLAHVQDFKGSEMNLVIKQGGSTIESKKFTILPSNPNNHYHYGRGIVASATLGSVTPNVFVDGWYFRFLHIDKTTSPPQATPFFFLFGNNTNLNVSSAPYTDHGCFILCANTGSINLDSNFLSPASGQTAASHDVEEVFMNPSQFSATAEYGLNTDITSTGTGAINNAMDVACKGNLQLASGAITWDLKLTKLNNSVISDYNPFSAFEGAFEAMHPTKWVPSIMFSRADMPLLRYIKSIPGLSAYYMSHNMNCFVSGEINWKGVSYTFDNDKGYQDSNWGGGGFPHPYVWLQANYFRDSGNNSLPESALVAMFSPGMPVLASLSYIGSICLRHDGHVYIFFCMDQDINTWYNPSDYAVLAGSYAADIIADITDFTCNVTFDLGGTIKTVDAKNVTDIYSKIGGFNPANIPPRSPPADPVGWSFTCTNEKGDHIEIEASCDKSTILRLSAPMSDKMVPGVVKESLHAKVTVTITPAGGTATTITSDFATAEFGD